MPYFLTLKANGFLDRAWNDAINAVSDLDCAAPPVASLALQLTDMVGVFVLYAISIALCFGYFAFGNKLVGPVYSRIIGRDDKGFSVSSPTLSSSRGEDEKKEADDETAVKPKAPA